MSTETTLGVVGMSCEHCVNAVTEELSRLDGVNDVVVDLASGRVAVTSDAPLDTADVNAAIDEAGYEVRP